MKVVEFENEQTLGDKKVKQVTLREPTFGDVRMVQKITDDIERQNQLIRRLADKEIQGITNEEFDAMPWSEYKKFSEAVEGFL